jgi:hypothetical protein
MTKERIQEALLEIDCIILTIKTFYKNCKLLEIAIYIIKQELINYRSGSLFDLLSNIWFLLSNCIIKIEEERFQAISLLQSVDYKYITYC